MSRLILGYLSLLLITSAVCFGLLLWLRKRYWPARAMRAVRKRPPPPAPAPNRQRPEGSWIERGRPSTLGDRIRIYRVCWRDATLADVLAGFRLPDSLLPPAGESAAAGAGEMALAGLPEPGVLAAEGFGKPAAAPPASVTSWRLDVRPDSVAITARGDLILLDLERSLVLAVNRDGQPIGQWSIAGLDSDRPCRMVVSPDGRLVYVADPVGRSLHRIALGPAGDAGSAPAPPASVPAPMEAAEHEPPLAPAGQVTGPWRPRAALLVGAAGVALTLRGLLLTLDTPVSLARGGVRWLTAGVALYVLAAWLAEAQRPFHLPQGIYAALRHLEKTRSANSRRLEALALRVWGAAKSAAQRSRGTRRLAGWLDVRPWQVYPLVGGVLVSGWSYYLAGDGALARHPAAAAACWLAGMTLVVLAAWKPARREATGRVTPGEVAAVAGLLVLALLLRVTATGRIPVILGGDEGVIGYASVAFAEGRANNLFNNTLASPSFYFALQGLSIRVFGHTIEALRFSSVVAGSLAVLAVYWLARSLFGRRMALLGAAYMAAFHFSVHFSRVALQNVWEELFVAAVLAGLWHGWSTGRRSAFLLAGLLLGLSQNFFPGVRLLFVVLLAWLLYALVRDRSRLYSNLPNLVLMGLAFLAAALPLGLYYLEHPQIYTEPLQRSFILAGTGPAHDHVFGQGQTVAQVLREQFSRAVQGFTHRDLQDWYTPGRPMLLPVPAALFMVGFFYALLRFGDPRFALILIPLIGDLVLGVALTTNPPSGQRMVMAAPSVALLVVLPLERAIHWLGQLRSRAAGVGRWLVVGLLVFIMALDVHFYFGVYTPGRNFRVANDEIAQRIAEHVDTLSPGGRGWHIYCICPPRMGYWTHPGIAYLAPGAVGHEVLDRLEAPPDWLAPGEHALFVFLPERLAELDWVKRAYPAGRRVDHWYHNGDLLFTTYEVSVPVNP